MKNKKGDKIGVFKYLCEADKVLQPSGKYRRMVKVICPECKNTHIAIPSNLKRGNISSCGCIQFKSIGEKVFKHGLTRHPLYFCWHDLKNRCNNKNFHSYHRYGGRGISIYPLWKTDFNKFYEWAISNGWEKGLEIDRINNNKGYFPNNCRFTTRLENIRNSTVTKLKKEVVLNIKKDLLKEKSDLLISKKYDISRVTIYNIRTGKTWRE